MKKETLLVVFLVTTSFLIRVFRLNTPPSYMFDEVYHAFTAVEMERGNKMAWEWWNKPPEGFAYEWTHPPLAKEAMIGGIKILGPLLPEQAPGVDGRIDPNPFAWRFPVALFGVGVVWLVYLLGKQLFNEKVGVFSALLINFDGLFFVQSRIGMNDTFFLFFMLLALYLFMRQKWWGLGVALGLALASKWTAIYAVLVLGGLFVFKYVLYQCIESLKQKAVKSLILPSIREITKFVLIFLSLPSLVYLLSYLPFFTSGHTWQQFDELQRQMWWYHTSLRATHPYTSPWYSWPLMYRPVWYYVNYGKDTIANIYAMGNPIIWWGGIVAIGYVLLSLIKTGWGLVMSRGSGMSPGGGVKRTPNSPLQLKTYPYSLILVLLGYFGFFLPWAFSPRIMFLYHYLPSIPFMCLALGYGLNKLWENPRFKLFTIYYLLFTILLFVYFYPHLSALAVPKWLAETYFWFPSWR